MGWGWSRLLHPQDADYVLSTWRAALTSGNEFQSEARLLAADGDFHRFLIRNVPLHDDHKSVSGWYGIGLNIDVQRLDQGHLQLLIDNVPALLQSARPEGELDFFNRRWLDYLGLPLDRLQGWDWREAVHPDDVERFVETWRSSLRNGTSCEAEARIRGADGQYRWHLHREMPCRDEDGKIIRWFGTSIDIEELKRAETELRKNKRELSEMVEAIPHAVVVLAPDGTTLRTNAYTLELTGLSHEQAGERTFRAVHPDDAAKYRDYRKHALAEGNPFQLELRALSKDGAYRWFLVHYKPLFDEDGKIMRWYATGTDINDRKRAEDALRRSEERLQLAIDTIPGLVWTASPNGDIDYLNQRWLEYTGMSLDEACGWGWRAAIHPEDLAGLESYWRSVLAAGTTGETVARLKRSDGTYRWFLFRGVPLHDESGALVKWYGQTTDIDDRKRAEDDLKTALAEIGKLKDQLYKENIALREEVDKASMFEEIVGDSCALRSVLSQVALVAPTDSTILMTGETGTGKELFARAIHKRSLRSSRAFVAVNCAAIPAPLIASELFGHEKGAFTGALQRRLGRFELADGGTIFLDEVGDLPAETQVALLRVLQEREFERVGGTQQIRCDVRVIAATNRDLQAAIEASSFRSDLFYRLNVFPIDLPPLRKRKGDIPILVEYFIERFARKAGKSIRTIDKTTLERLQAYS
jgi:formate hydrogenlyase transcriptional activator